MAISREGRKMAREQLNSGGIRKKQVGRDTKRYQVTLNSDMVDALRDKTKMKLSAILQNLVLEKAREEGIL
jgi:hypothetical protein